MRVTLKDVARLAEVNFTLVSKYLNQTPGTRMREETRARIAAAIKTLHYRPISAARTLKCGKSETLGLVVGNLTNEYFAHYADAAITEAQKHGYRLLISVCRDGDPEKAINDLYANQVDGIVCCDCFYPQNAPCPLLTERSFDQTSMLQALTQAFLFLKERACNEILGLYTDERWPDIFHRAATNSALNGRFEFLPRNLDERLELLRKLCQLRYPAIFSSGWQTVVMLSRLLDREFPDYHPQIILWANCRGSFLSNQRITGILHTSTLLSIKETFCSLCSQLQKDDSQTRPQPVPCRFISRDNPEYCQIIADKFQLT